MRKRNDSAAQAGELGQSSPARGFQVPEGVKYLDAFKLAQYERAFERWHKDTPGAATRRARGRVWLTFLVLRYAGARLQETLDLDDAADVDADRAVVRFRGGEEAGREVQLPLDAAREIRTFLEAPENASLRGKVFRMDQGHVRRKFQEVGALAGLPKELSNPTALRRSRAIELLRSDVPLKAVQSILGQGTANLAGSLLEFSDDETRRILGQHLRRENAKRMSARNAFFGKVSRIEIGDIQSEVELTTLGGYPVVAMITNGSLRSMGLKEGMYATAIVKAPWVALAKGEEKPAASARNAFLGKAASIAPGRICAEATVELPDGVNVCSVITEQSARDLDLRPGDAVWVMFESFAVILLAE